MNDKVKDVKNLAIAQRIVLTILITVITFLATSGLIYWIDWLANN